MLLRNKISILRDKINIDDSAYPAAKGEQDLKLLMNKWNADITRTQLLNKLVKPTDTVKAKNDIQSKLRLLTQNPENFRISNGFKTLESTLGVDKMDKLIKDKKIEEDLVVTKRERTPTYTERKKVLQAEWSEKMKDTQHLIEKVSKLRKDIKINHKNKKLEDKKKQEAQTKLQEKQKKQEEEEKEKLRQKKLEELEERKRRFEEDKKKQIQQMRDYQKKFVR